MNCKKCGAPLVENDQFCKNCGAAVNEVNAQNNVIGNQSTFPTSEFNSVQQSSNNRINGQSVNSVEQPMNIGASMGGQTVNPVPQPVQQSQQVQQTSPVSQPMNMYTGMGEQAVNSVSQPINFVQQPMNNKSQKNNNLKYILIGVGVIAVVAIALILGFVLGGKNNTEATDKNTNVVSNTPTYTVNFKGFTFKIPTNLIYETQENAILLGDEEGTWASYIEVVEGSYNKILANKNQLQGIYQQSGFTSSAAVTKTVGGLEFITLELSSGGQNALLGFAKANSMNIFGITLYTQANEFDYDLLETMSSILKTAEFNDVTNNISGFEKMDMSGISELAQ